MTACHQGWKGIRRRVFEEDDSPGPAVGAQTTIVDNNEYVSKRVLSFVIKFAEILLQAAKQESQRIASQPIDLLTNTSFDLNSFRKYIKILADCREVAKRNKREPIKDDGLRRVLVRSEIGKTDGSVTLHVKDVTERLQKNVEMCWKDDIILRPEGRNASLRITLPNMTTEYIRTCYELVKKEAMRSCHRGSVWIENSDGNAKSFVSFVQFFSDETVMTL